MPRHDCGFLTSSIPRHAVDELILADLEETTVTRLADTIVTSMPCSSNLVPDFPLLLAVAHCHYGADDFVAWSQWEGSHLAHRALLSEGVRMTDTTRMDFDKHFTLLRVLDIDLLDSPWRTSFLDDDGAALLWDLWSHCIADDDVGREVIQCCEVVSD